MATTFRVQYLATLSVNLITICYGISVGWSSPTMPLLRSDATPLASGALTLSEQSMVTAILCIGGAFGSILFGWMSDKLGRKRTLLLMAAPMAISWLMIAYAQNAMHLNISRFLAGFSGGGVFVVVPVYVSEIVHDSVRGTLGSALVLLNNGGVLIGFIIGAFLDYFVVPFIALGFVACYLIAMTILPETPPYLFAQLRVEDGEQALRFLRGVNVRDKSVEFEHELKQLRGHNSSSDVCEMENGQKIAWADFFVPSTFRALYIGFVLIMMTQMNGVFSITNYTSSIFKDAGSSLEPNNATIIVGVIQLVGAYISGMLADRAGRKFLIVVSAFGTGFCLTVMGAFLFVKECGVDVTSYSWIPIASLSGVVFIASTGLLPLAFVVLPEILPQNLKSTVTSGFCFLCWMAGYLLVKYFSTLIEVIGLHGCMWFFAGCCFFEVVFVVVFMPETKGKSFEQIQQLLNKNSK